MNKSREVRILSVWNFWSENPVVQNIWRFTVSQINVLVFFGFLTRLGMSSSLVLGYSVKTLCSFPWIHKHSSSTSSSISPTTVKTSNISFIDSIGNQVTSGPKWVNIKWAAFFCLCHHRDEKVISKQLNPPFFSPSFLGWHRCQKSLFSLSKVAFSSLSVWVLPFQSKISWISLDNWVCSVFGNV